jgi:DNA polymerase V
MNKKNAEIELEIYKADNKEDKRFSPLSSSDISAGFPSPADDYFDKTLDLNEYLIKNPASSFLLRVKGDSMVDAGIFEGDIVIVDKALEASNGKIVIAIVDGEFTIKRIMEKKGKLFLKAENPNYKAIEITEEMDVKIWGVVCYTIHKT